MLSPANAVQAYVRPLPPPPPESGLYTTAPQTVFGFLAASATYAYDPEAAGQFLTRNLRKNWRPGPVTVVSSLGPVTTSNPGLRIGNSSPAQYPTTTVHLTVQHLATLKGTGQYEYSAGTSKLTFTLAKQPNGEWLITGLPQGGRSLLLTKTSFQEVYQPRNLFFFARQEPSVVNGELVPDPVYAPVQSADSALNIDVVDGLVRGLLKDQGSWLADATTTAFPRGTTLLKPVALRGQVAIVDLGGTAARASAQQKNNMLAQLRATLTSKAYSNPLARSVVLEIDGRPQYQGSNSNLVSKVSAGPLVYQSGISAVSELNRPPVVEPAQIDSEQITALAAITSSNVTPGSGNGAQPVPAVAVAVPDGSGCAVEMPVSPAAQSGPYKSYPVSTSGGPCTSLNWDRNGNLWAVAGGRVMQLPWQGGKFLTVSSPVILPSHGKPGGRILSLQMAPDGVRAALLVRTPLGNRVLLAAVTNNVQQQGGVSLGDPVPVWTGLPDPTALSWYNPYDLVVLAKTGIWQVPLTGGAGRLLGSAPAHAESLASNGVTLVVGTKDAVYTFANGANAWKYRGSGALPTYPSQELGVPVSGAR